jgi:hypothetical protein
MVLKTAKWLVAIGGLALLAGLLLMDRQAVRVEAAGSAPVIESLPTLFWQRLEAPPGPAQLAIWVMSARRSGDTVQNVLVPLDPSNPVFTVLEDSLPLLPEAPDAGFSCHLDANSNKVLRCDVHPAPGGGYIHAILTVHTAEGDVLEGRVRFPFQPPG